MKIVEHSVFKKNHLNSTLTVVEKAARALKEGWKDGKGKVGDGVGQH